MMTIVNGVLEAAMVVLVLVYALAWIVFPVASYRSSRKLAGLYASQAKALKRK